MGVEQFLRETDCLFAVDFCLDIKDLLRWPFILPEDCGQRKSGRAEDAFFPERRSRAESCGSGHRLMMVSVLDRVRFWWYAGEKKWMGGLQDDDSGKICGPGH